MTLTLDRQNAYRARYRALRPGWRPATEVYEATIRRCLTPEMYVIDVGCGRGGVLEQLDLTMIKTFGLDPDLRSLREHRMPGLRRAQAIADMLPLRAGCADVAICSWVLEHLAEPARTFAEIARILRPGGRFIFLTPNARSLIVTLNKALRPFQQLLVPRLYGRAEADTFPVRYRANTRGQIARLAAGAGLRIASLEMVEDPTYLAFSPTLFRFSVAMARFTPPVHIVAMLEKPVNFSFNLP